jgi:DNA-binding CsgD family transcriptional regulator
MPADANLVQDLPQRIIEELEMGIFVCDSDLRCVQYANPDAVEFLRAFGGASAPLGRALRDLIAESLREAVSDRFPRAARAVPARGARYCLRAKYLSRGGSRILVNVARHVDREQETLALLRGRFSLSAREIEIVRWIHAGFTNDQIARRLKLSLGTIKQHLARIFTSVGVHSRTQLLAVLQQVADTRCTGSAF